MYHMALSPDGRYLATAGGKTLQVFETLSGNPLAHAEDLERGSSANAVAFSRDGRYLAMGELNGTAWVVEASSGRPAARLAYEGLVVAMAFSPDGGMWLRLARTTRLGSLRLSQEGLWRALSTRIRFMPSPSVRMDGMWPRLARATRSGCLMH